MAVLLLIELLLGWIRNCLEMLTRRMLTRRMHTHSLILLTTPSGKMT